MGDSINGEVLFWGLQMKDPSILGSYWVPLIFANSLVWLGRT